MSASTWGNPNAIKRVLLIHGLTSSSQFWHRIGVEFASRDYYVIAPDLLGHGNARRSSDYSIAALAGELQPFFTAAKSNDHPYDIVVGHSFGAIVTCALLPRLKSTRSVRVVLVDPPLEHSEEQLAAAKVYLRSLFESVKTLEDYQEQVTFRTKEDVIFGWSSGRLCDVNAVDSILDQNIPWSFSRLLLTVPDNVKVIALAADPSKVPALKEEDLKAYPHITAKVIWGASHLIPVDAPQSIIDAALEGTASQN